MTWNVRDHNVLVQCIQIMHIIVYHSYKHDNYVLADYSYGYDEPANAGVAICVPTEASIVITIL